MRFHLDAPLERASDTVLRDIGVQENDEGYTWRQVNAQPGVELYSDSPVRVAGADSVAATKGECFVDIRDSADSWVRCFLASLECMQLVPNVYFRVGGSARIFLPLDNTCELAPRREALSDVTAPQMQPRELLVELCAHFYNQGWVSGTGGSISIRHGARIYMSPSGVQKERMQPDEMFVIDSDGGLLFSPSPVPGRPKPRLSQCAPLFLQAYNLRRAGACIHTHSIHCVNATLLFDNEVVITHQEMIKGVLGFGYHDTLVIPIIENTAHERDLAQSLGEAIEAYPNVPAVLVRRHGIYVWGDSWVSAKTQAECIHYLLEAAVAMKTSLSLDPGIVPSECTHCAGDNEKRARSSSSISDCTDPVSRPKRARTQSQMNGQPKVVLLDIEGTTTPISFVKKVLFPYALEHGSNFFEHRWTQVSYLAQQMAEEMNLPVPRDARAAYAIMQQAIAQDLKITPLKKIQGMIWHDGYTNGSLQGEVFEDVLPAMERWLQNGIRVAIYSSGSRSAQRLLFEYSRVGDLTRYISAYFDTTSGNKREPQSYKDIALSLGVDPGRILFLTDIVEEAQAAQAAGCEPHLMVRPGNDKLERNAFKRFTTFDTIWNQF